MKAQTMKAQTSSPSKERLAAEGLLVTVDGVYGEETADAVMAFQEQQQLTVDGVVGSEKREPLGIWTS
jgi:peptidoglycan hydrolase-like protein with peptidoglycan-binding domain